MVSYFRIDLLAFMIASLNWFVIRRISKIIVHFMIKAWNLAYQYKTVWIGKHR